MPYSKMSDIPSNLRTMDGVSLTLDQVNWIASIAEGIPQGKVENPWAVAKAKFKQSYIKRGGKWVKRKKAMVRKAARAVEESLVPGVMVSKDSDGRYRIVAISTAALEDKEGDTFETVAMDYDIHMAEKTGEYPEFRVFHSPALGIGRVEKMSRIGIFAVDEGISYDDPFSLAVCKSMLAGNDGTWRVSRGFMVCEASGLCSSCGEDLVIGLKHMIAGFRCPSCKEVHLGYRSALKKVRFRKARTFDVTVTDVPAVTTTSVGAFTEYENKEFSMTKKQLKDKLLKAGLSEEQVDARLSSVSDERLKELDDIPDAVLLKEFSDDSAGSETVLVLDTEVLKEFSELVEDTVSKLLKEALDGLTIEVPDMEMELKELPAVDKLADSVAALKESVDSLLQKDEVRLKELLRDAPRGAKLRIRRFKETSEVCDDEDEDSDNGEKPPTEEKERDQIMLGDGTVVGSLSEAVIGGYE